MSIKECAQSIQDGRLDRSKSLKLSLFEAFQNAKLNGAMQHIIPILAENINELDKFKLNISSDIVFIGGAPRSGTTALGKLINLFDGCSIFTEAYSYLLGYHPSMFNDDFIKYMQKSHYVKSLLIDQNLAIQAKLSSSVVIGDKRPNYIFSHLETSRLFGTKPFKVFQLIRDPYRVASSYMVRVQKNTFDSSRDYKMAVDEMNMNNRLALKYAQCNKEMLVDHELIILDYDLFWRDKKNALYIADKLDVNINE